MAEEAARQPEETEPERKEEDPAPAASEGAEEEKQDAAKGENEGRERSRERSRSRSRGRSRDNKAEQEKERDPLDDDTTGKIFIGGIASNLKEGDVRDDFSKFGEIKEVLLCVLFRFSFCSLGFVACSLRLSSAGPSINSRTDQEALHS